MEGADKIIAGSNYFVLAIQRCENFLKEHIIGQFCENMLNWVFSHVTVAILVYRATLLGIELYFYANTFFGFIESNVATGHVKMLYCQFFLPTPTVAALLELGYGLYKSFISYLR